MRLGSASVSATRLGKRDQGLSSATGKPSALSAALPVPLRCPINMRCRVSVQSAKDGEPERCIKRTLADLDAVLGVVDEALSSSSSFSGAISATESMSTFDTDATALHEHSRATLFPGTIQEDMFKITQRVRGIIHPDIEAGAASSPIDLDIVLQDLAKQEPISKEDMKTMRESVFGNRLFSVTETKPYSDIGRRGVAFRGRLRADRGKVFEEVNAKIHELFSGRYEVMMVSDMESAHKDEALWGGASVAPPTTPGGVPVAFLVVPAEQAAPPPQTIFHQLAGLATGVVLAGACSHLGIMANFSHIPQDLLDYLEHRHSYPPLAEGMLPPGFEQLDIPAYLAVAVPLAGSVFAMNAVHELGHHMAAFVRKVKLGSALHVPSLDLGSFGAITPFASLLKGHRDLWDVAAAGPLAGMACSVAVLSLGLLQSHSGVAKELLMTVPSCMFQGSLLMGTAARMVLGEEVLRAAEVSVSPLVVAGWCGVMVNSLQLLPVGSLDGGRLVQAVWGKKCLGATSALTYLTLAMGMLATDLAVPFGLYVFFCQREAESYIKDNVTSAGDSRQAATVVAMLTALLVLMPMAPEVADVLGMGGPNTI